MTLERFAFVTFLIAMLFLLAACGGDSDSIMDPQPQYELMEYRIVGRITLESAPTEGVPGVTVSITGPTDRGPGELIAKAVTDATGSFDVRYVGRARASGCFPITSNDGTPYKRGHEVHAHKEGYHLERYTAECGVSHHSWYPRMRERRESSGCIWYCPPYF